MCKNSLSLGLAASMPNLVQTKADIQKGQSSFEQEGLPSLFSDGTNPFVGVNENINGLGLKVANLLFTQSQSDRNSFILHTYTHRYAHPHDINKR